MGDAPAAERPAPLLEVLPQVWVQRRTVEQIVDPVLVVPMLHVFVPQMVEQLVDILAPLDFRVAEQVIDVPKMLCPPRAARTVLREPQTVDQLVEVPTIVSWSLLLQRIMEQHVDIPVAGGGGRSWWFARFSSRTEFNIATWSQERCIRLSGGVEQIAVSRVGDGLQDFLPGQSSASSSRDPGRGFEALDELFGYGVFRTFPQIQKSAAQPPHSRSELPPHSSPWTPAPFDASMVLEEEEEEESELDEAEEVGEVTLMVEYVACDGSWWGQHWVPTAQQFCWWLAADDGSQLGHTIWRPPWDFP